MAVHKDLLDKALERSNKEISNETYWADLSNSASGEYLPSIHDQGCTLAEKYAHEAANEAFAARLDTDGRAVGFDPEKMKEINDRALKDAEDTRKATYEEVYAEATTRLVEDTKLEYDEVIEEIDEALLGRAKVGRETPLIAAGRRLLVEAAQKLDAPELESILKCLAELVC